MAESVPPHESRACAPRDRAKARLRRMAIVVASLALGSLSGSNPSEPSTTSVLPREILPGWSLRVVREMPEMINSMATAPDAKGPASTLVFVGTSPVGGVYRVDPMLPSTVATVAVGLGDQFHFGVCHVSRLVVSDMDRDGRYELLATTSQIVPPGRTRLYAWSLESGTSTVLGIARPEIRSQWSHGLSVVRHEGGERAFAVFCGNGEIVEYRMSRGKSESGFSSEGLTWKQVGRLPASGEWAQCADVDNDGVDEMVFATGYATGAAAIQIYEPGPSGREVILEREIDEDRRFGNVRFVVGARGENGAQELVAWWCTDFLYGGDCEMIHYQLGPEGVRSRRAVARGPARSLWPDDGQFAMADVDGDGSREVWFATSGGSLWSYEGSESGNPIRVLQIDGGLGPLAAVPVANAARSTLFLSSGRTLLRLDRGREASSRTPIVTGVLR
jgi:hypothetical protein